MAVDRLDAYRAKRDFSRTPEPGAAEETARTACRFVVQEHHARRLHWDFRLERDGVLVSWALPRGFPEDPDEDLPAARTEDHPLDYIAFEGTIPDGSYGAGDVTVWDRGRYVCEAFEDAKVVVELHGERLRGRYALYRTREDWRIHRMDPRDPGREPMPERIVPMLAQLGDLPADAERYGFEVGWDGIRTLGYWRPGRWHVETRDLADVTARWPELRPLGRQLGARSAVLDGEIVAFDASGRPSFERLQSRMHLTGEAAIRRRAREIPAVFVLFDLLWLDGESLMERPYSARRAALEELALDGPAWQTPAYHRGDGANLLAATREQGLKGIVAKRLDSRYEPGRRSGAWITVEHTRRQEPEIGGWLRGEPEHSERLVEVDGRRLRLTSLRKVLYPEAGFTKAEALHYYASVAPTLLPHLLGRAMTLKRYPDGVAGPHFYDKHCRNAPPWVETAPMWSERKGESINFCRLEDAASLLWSVNFGNLEMHPLLSIAPDFDTPTTVVFDLDPGEGASILDAAEIGLVLHDLLRGIGLDSLAKSTGSNGVHVYVPLNTPATFEQTKAFSRNVAEVMAARMADRVVARIDKRTRTGKVLIDWGQNDRHKSTVAAYSLRAKLSRPTVALPLRWADLRAAVDSGRSDALLPTPHEALDRVGEAGDLFAAVLSLKQQLPALTGR